LEQLTNRWPTDLHREAAEPCREAAEPFSRHGEACGRVRHSLQTI